MGSLKLWGTDRAAANGNVDAGDEAVVIDISAPTELDEFSRILPEPEMMIALVVAATGAFVTSVVSAVLSRGAEHREKGHSLL